MKAVILAGGFGTRLSEETIIKPKPMVEIGGIPILVHIMNYYSFFDIKDFIVCSGYKSEYIKNYFSNFFINNSDICVDLSKNKIEILNKQKKDWKVSIVDTGTNTMTGGRLKRVKDYVGNEDFCFTYGDCLCNVNIKDTIELHKKNKVTATLTAVLTPERFGNLEIEKKTGLIKNFKEKPVNTTNFINGGYFILSPKIFSEINSDNTIFEKDVLEKLAQQKKLAAYQHTDFWFAMDKLSDKLYLEELWKNNKAPWKKD